MTTAAHKQSFIEAKNVSYAIHDKLIIDGFSYAFTPGQFYILAGESGCGKTTLLSILAGYMKPTKGSVILSTPGNISFYSESGACFFDLTVYQNLAVFSKDDACIDEALFLVGLSDRKNQKTNTLSKGEIARLALARMILCDSPVMFFDEPVANLDVENRHKFFSVLRHLSKSKIVIVANHDLSLIEEKDIVLKYNDRHNFEKNQFFQKSDHQIETAYPRMEKAGIKKHISLIDGFLFAKNIFKRSIKQFVVLVPVFFFLFFVYTNSIAFVANKGNDIFYDVLNSCNINGTLIQDTASDDSMIFDGLYGRFEDSKECILLAVKPNSSITINHSEYTLGSEADAIIPSSYAKEFGIRKGDDFCLFIYGEKKVFLASAIYEYHEIVADPYLSDVSEDNLSDIRLYNQPIIIKTESARENRISTSFKYAMTDYFKKDQSLKSGNFMLECLNQNMVDIIANKDAYNVPYYYFLWSSIGLMIVSLYFYSVSVIKALQNDLLVFKLTKNKIIDLVLAGSLSGFLYMFCMEGLSLIFSALFSLPFNGMISRFYLLNTAIDLLPISAVPIVSSLLLLLFDAVLLFAFVFILGQLKIHKKMNRSE